MPEKENKISSEQEYEQNDFTNESTIFSAPAEHKDKKKTGKFSLTKKVLAVLLVLCILVGSVFLVVKYIPMLEDNAADVFKPKEILNIDNSLVQKLTVTNEKCVLVINSQKKEVNNTLTQVFTLKGYDETLIDSVSLSQIASYATQITSFGEYDYNAQTEAEKYGFDNPYIKVEVETTATEGNYTLLVGNKTADGGYFYLNVSAFPKKVYIVTTGTMNGFVVEPLNLATNNSVPAIEKNDKNAAYFDSDGNLADFDSITISGSDFKKPLVFVPNKEQQFSSFATYICTSPKYRIADGVIEDIRNMFNDGISSSGVVSFDKTAKSLKEFGLDKPDVIITLKVAGTSYDYKFKATNQRKTEFFVVCSSESVIKTVTVTNVPFIANKEEDFYLGFMTLESISDISDFNLKGEIDASFSIKKDEDDDSGYIIMSGNKKIESEAFQDFYALFIQTVAVNYDTKNVSSKPDLTITLKHNDNSKDTVITFYKISESRYQYNVGSIPMGQIPSSSYSKIVRDATNLVS